MDILADGTAVSDGIRFKIIYATLIMHHHHNAYHLKIIYKLTKFISIKFGKNDWLCISLRHDI